LNISPSLNAIYNRIYEFISKNRMKKGEQGKKNGDANNNKDNNNNNHPDENKEMYKFSLLDNINNS